MDSFRSLRFFVLLAFTVISACSSSSNPTRDSVTPTFASPNPIPLTYPLGASDDHRVVQLTDGKYRDDSVNVTVSDVSALNSADSAFVVYENYGGAGNFAFLALYRNGNFLAAAFIDDRPIVNSLSFDNGEIVLDATTHTIGDARRYPQFRALQRYAITSQRLRLTHFASSASDGSLRDISITSSSSDSTSIELTGSTTFAPFAPFIYPLAKQSDSSATQSVTDSDFAIVGATSSRPTSALAYHIFDLNGIELASGLIPVINNTFAATIPLISQPYILELRASDPIDNSLIAMASLVPRDLSRTAPAQP